MKKPKTEIIEKQLGIPPDYQQKALKSVFFPRSNWHRNKLLVIKQIIFPKKSLRILDLGAGSGNFELTFHSFAKHITAMDYNDEATEYLKNQIRKNKIKNVRVITSDIINLHKVKGLGKFDAILMIDVIEHIHMKELSKILLTMRRLLTRNGRVFIITPNYKSPWSLIEWLMDRSFLSPKHGGCQHVTKFDKKNIETLFSKHSFLMKSFLTFNHISFLMPSKELSKKVLFKELLFGRDVGNLLACEFTSKK